MTLPVAVRIKVYCTIPEKRRSRQLFLWSVYAGRLQSVRLEAQMREVRVDQGRLLSIDGLLYVEVQEKIFATAPF